MSFSKELQAKVKEHLQGMVCSASFELNSHAIDVQRRRKNERETVLAVFIDGSIEGKNLGAIDENTLPVAQKVYRHRVIARYKPKEIKEIEKVFGKRRAKKTYPNLHSKDIYLDCSFNSAASLVRQFAKLKGIKLVKLGGEPV